MLNNFPNHRAATLRVRVVVGGIVVIAVNEIMTYRVINVIVILLVRVISAFAQDQKSVCPNFKLIPPSSLVEPYEKVTVTLELNGNPSQSSAFVDWFVSSGKIASGQGAKVVEILTDEGNAGSKIKVAALVHGLPGECVAFRFAEFEIAPLPIGEPVDQMGKVGPTSEELNSFLSRLDSYFIRVSNSPGYEGLITVEFNKSDSLKHKILHLQRIYRHAAFRKLGLTRITFAIVEWNAAERTMLWTMHPQAKLPKDARHYRIFRAEDYKNRLNCIFPLD